jgi:hypothetical protein
VAKEFRWRILWKDKVTGVESGGEPVFRNREEAEEYLRLEALGEDKSTRLFSFEAVLVDLDTGKW